VTPDTVAGLTRALTDDDHVVRGLAALGLRDAGSAAASARGALLARLKDDDTGVRMIAAQAIGRLRDPSTLDVLMVAGREDGQHVHVLRSIADALGDLGRAAAPALPLLRELAKQPRVRWAAEAAIRKIER
jgi:HEAT repeat protein